MSMIARRLSDQLRYVAACLALLALFGMGCTSEYVHPLTPPMQAVVWPKPPDEPRVRYLGSLTGSADAGEKPTAKEAVDAFFFGKSPPKQLVTPYAVDVRADRDVVAIADTGTRSVHVLDLDGRAYREITGCGDPEELFTLPVGVAWVGESLWVADAGAGRLGVIVLNSGNTRWLGTERLQRPAGIAYCETNGLCYVTDAAQHTVLAFEKDGTYAFQFGTRGAGPGQFNTPSHIDCAAEEVAVSDSLNFRVQRFGLDGTVLDAFGRKGDAAGDLALPKGVAFDADRNLWVVDAHFENVQAFTPKGQLLMALGREGTEVGEFWLPSGICIDAAGRIWIADGSNQRVQVFEIMAL